ncbi:hypothetical protein GC105_01530 [Alkalibaculum sp. M08DMB]|uniref:Aromatic acid exporter family protein n=1 Tax=Alkalibaculum sporogenes TaxID=2655001 RepID=A0A6A7K563_9FIRM|nr:aromatic acid exporter family protein [Alkalibaculum sporogenes]MPW24474.1 hypothetical protein [Alkalibaculum sporogenes]
MSYKIGMRNIKTALSVFICIAIYQIFDFRYPLFAVIAAIVSMESSVMHSFKIGLNRLMGTALGAVFGLAFALVRPNDVFLATIGIVVVIYICNILNWNKSITIATIVFISILFDLGESQVLFYSVERIFDTFVGISISLVVNFLIHPYNFEKSIRRQMDTIIKEIYKLVNESVCTVCFMELDKLNFDLTNLSDELKQYESEVKLKKSGQQRIGYVKSTVSILKEIYTHLRVIAPIIEGRHLTDANLKILENLNFDVNKIDLGELSNNLDYIYNYHLGIILENLQLLDTTE